VCVCVCVCVSVSELVLVIEVVVMVGWVACFTNLAFACVLIFHHTDRVLVQERFGTFH
jgi:hypothetical protein